MPGGGFVRTGHRGARGLAPENTMASFTRAVQEGVDALEFDVHMTADEEIVVCHDPTVDRTTGGVGRIADMTLAELRALDAGYRFQAAGTEGFPQRAQGVQIPLLREVLEAFPEHLFTVELKESPHPGFVAAVLKLCEALAPGRVQYGCFPHAQLSELRRLAPQVPTGCSHREIRIFYALNLFRLTRLFPSASRVLQVPRFSDFETDSGLKVVTPRFVRAAHKSGRSVQVWTINDPELMTELLDWGVDGITTDRPDVLNEVLRRRG